MKKIGQFDKGREISYLWLKFNWFTLFATSLNGVVPLGVGLNLKRTSEAEKLLTPSSKMSSKSVSTKRMLSGSINVIFFVFGPMLRIKVSPFVIVWGIPEFWVNSILIGSLKSRV